MSHYPRWQTAVVKATLTKRRVVILAGARQSGKTTLAKLLSLKNTEYRTLDDKVLLEAAVHDPHEFVKHNNHLMIIDEVQKAPGLLPAIKKIVDEDNRPGQYLLTGSANIQALPGVTESLAGRISKIKLRPLAQGEIIKKKPNFLRSVFSQTFKKQNLIKLDRDEIINIAMRGGYPEVITASAKDRNSWHRDYIDAILERDLKDIINIRRQDAMRNLLHVVAAWSTKMIDLSSIGANLSIKRPTIESYLNALESLYLIERVMPWTKTDYERVGKQQKLMMVDSGLMASILQWQPKNIRFDKDKLGKLIETHVGCELQKHIDASDEIYALYHYRDREKREIDFLIENDDNQLLGIEVKSSSNVGLSEFKHLKWFSENIVLRNKTFIGIVLYTGEHIVSFGDGFWAIPISALYAA